jgi:hypothetical protein
MFKVFIFSNPISIFCYASKSFLLTYKVLLKNMFDLGNLLFTVLNDYFEFYKILESGLNGFDA